MPGRIATLTIPNGGTTSNIIGGRLFNFLKSIAIMAPATLSGVVSVEVADTQPATAVAADFRVLQSGGTDVTVTADDATTIDELGFTSLRLVTTVAPGSDEVYDVTGQDDPAAIST